MNYSPTEIEPKWQQYWAEHATFRCDEQDGKPKYYILDMFPYPSGSGLHVGHGIGYTVTDIIARFKRMKGFNVLHPMGWDSFGLPAEQYAIRTGTHPAITTESNIEKFREQLQAYGYSYDWSRELRTSDPNYYRWTQWIFTLLYERGLAYQAQVMVNYCPALGTVLANEEVEEGRSVEGGHPVIRKPLRQWVLKITAYAERLIKDLDLLDWPENLKRQQENWIGRSEGALIDFEIEGSADPLSVFTTRPETLFGVSYLLLAPEHPLVAQIVLDSQKAQVESYLEQVRSKSDLQRTDLNREKSGVFTGAYARHPVTGERLPVWVADYVLMTYATGAVMAVPAHDERDGEFARHYQLPILPVLEEERVISSSHAALSLDGSTLAQARDRVIAWLESSGRGRAQVTYKLRDWLFSRQRYWGEPIPVLHFEDGSVRSLQLDELPLLPPEVNDYRPAGDGQSPLASQKEWVSCRDPKTGREAMRETNTMPQWAGSCWYYLRFIDPHNDHEAWSASSERYWMPVDTYVGGAEHAVLHLLYARFWHKVLFDCGLVTSPEPFMQLRNQGMVVAKAYKLPSGGYVAPEEVACQSGEWVHLPSGQRVIELVEKMSKSKLNGVSPDLVIKEHGADALRLYSMFLGPYDKEKLWDNKAVSGCSRFLRRFAALFEPSKRTQELIEEAMVLTHQLCHQVEKELEQWQFNVAIAKMMEFLNRFEKLAAYPECCLDILARLIAPFAPHLGEELWQQRLGRSASVAYVDFPQADLHWLAKGEHSCVTYVIQVNGKLRARRELARGLTQQQVFEQSHEQVARYLEGQRIVKQIFVQDKLLNIVAAHA